MEKLAAAWRAVSKSRNSGIWRGFGDLSSLFFLWQIVIVAASIVGGVLLWAADHPYIAPFFAVSIWAVGEIALSYRMDRKANHLVDMDERVFAAPPATAAPMPAATPHSPPLAPKQVSVSDMVLALGSSPEAYQAR